MTTPDFAKIRQEIITQVRMHMSWSNAKTMHWFVLPNPLLGGVSPQFMVESGRTEKLKKWINDQIEESDICMDCPREIQ